MGGGRSGLEYDVTAILALSEKALCILAKKKGGRRKRVFYIPMGEEGSRRGSSYSAGRTQWSPVSLEEKKEKGGFLANYLSRAGGKRSLTRNEREGRKRNGRGLW